MPKKLKKADKNNSIVLAWINPQNLKDRGRQKFRNRKAAETAAKTLEQKGYDVAYVNTKYKPKNYGSIAVSVGKSIFKQLENL